MVCENVPFFICFVSAFCQLVDRYFAALVVDTYNYKIH